MVSYADNTSAQFEHFIEKMQVKADKVQGGAFAVFYKGEVVHKKVFGKARLNKNAVTEKTLFPLASVSKAITAIAIAKLIEEKKLLLDENFSLSGLKEKTNLIQILSHTTGYQIRGDYEIEKGLTYLQILNILKQQKKTCKNCYYYSNVIFNLSLQILKQHNFLLKDAIENLNIEGIDVAPFEQKEIVAYIHPSNRDPYLYSKYAITVPASAGIYASLNGATELLRLAWGYKEGIDQQILNQFFSSRAVANDIFRWKLNLPKSTKSYYGLGWRILKFNAHDSLFFHSGKVDGMFAFIGFMPSKKIAVIFMINGYDKKLHNMQNIMDFFINFQAL